MFAVVETGGKQYKVMPGDQLDVEFLGVEQGQQFDLGQVLMVGGDGGEVLVGNPIVAGARVLATVVTDHRGDKIIVFKYKPKKRYRRKTGHRQTLTRITIDDILADGFKSEVSTTAKPATKKAAQAATAEAELAATTTEPTEVTDTIEVSPAPKKASKAAKAEVATETAAAAVEAEASGATDTAPIEGELEWVNGIGPVYNRILAEHGISTNAELANATIEQLKATGISHESDEEFASWIEQAKDKLAEK